VVVAVVVVASDEAPDFIMEVFMHVLPFE